MSVVKMSKFSLTGLASEKDALLDALHRTQRVELSDWEEENAPSSELQSRVSRVRKGIAFVSDRIAESKKTGIFPRKIPRGSRTISCFPTTISCRFRGREAELTAAMEKAETLEKELSALRAERVKAKNLIEQLSAYREVNERFSDFSDRRNSSSAPRVLLSFPRRFPERKTCIWKRTIRKSGGVRQFFQDGEHLYPARLRAPGGMRFRARGNRCGHARRGDGIYRTDRGRYAADAFEKPRAREKRGIRHKYVFRARTYREYDPNGVVFWFFMIFFGLIMADIGYGILLFAGGLLLSARLKIDNGFKN